MSRWPVKTRMQAEGLHVIAPESYWPQVRRLLEAGGAAATGRRNLWKFPSEDKMARCRRALRRLERGGLS